MPAGSAAVAGAVPGLVCDSWSGVLVAGLKTGHYFFRGGSVGFAGAEDGVAADAEKERTRITSCQRWSSVSFLRKEGMGLRPWVI